MGEQPLDESPKPPDRATAPRPPESAAGRDQAAQSLADALRVSFRLLTGIMVIFVLLFLWTGVRSIDPYEVGVRKLFGKVTDTAEEGLAFSWPFPIGDMVVVNTSEQLLEVDDFWMYETPEDRTKDLTARSGGDVLRPGYDGVLLTGDRGLLHVRLTCKYQVKPEGVRDFVANVAGDSKAPAVRDLVRSVICRAAIRAAADRTADSLLRTERKAFVEAVRRSAQRDLDDLPAGIDLRIVELGKLSWPIKALSAYSAAQRAVSDAEGKRNTARGEAEKILQSAAGPIYRQLVGDPVEPGASTRPAGGPDEPYNLIRQYDEARNAGETERAARLQKQIDDVLLSDRLGGDASRIIAEARSEKTAIEQRALARERRFRRLLPEFQASGQFMLDRLWAQTRDRILNSPTIEKYYVTLTDSQPTVLHINRDPAVVQDITREQARQAKEAEQKKQKEIQRNRPAP